MPRPEYRREAETLKELRNFLMRKPRPEAFRVYTDEGVTDYQVTPEENFSDLADRLDSLEPSKIVAYQNGEPLRAWRPPEPKPGIGGEIPEGLRGDVGAQTLHHFANLLARAYEHSTDVAFDRLAGMLDALLEDSRERNERLRELENMYFGALHANVNLAASAHGLDEDAEPTDPREQMLSTFMQSMAEGQQARPKKQRRPETEPTIESEGDET